MTTAAEVMADDVKEKTLSSLLKEKVASTANSPQKGSPRDATESPRDVKESRKVSAGTSRKRATSSSSASLTSSTKRQKNSVDRSATISPTTVSPTGMIIQELLEKSSQ
ncbi:expressed unknown protein [Seminavis robusta]|uniref:Uncharacterized protein n=1 Tax=Seminavis robusta TaxID=568900 RepID=A0A9N8D8Q6_9STRA|nr:expressed unknown protein [Seminavis robusta]|eukprot:Sro17_g012310.1 n/a (109) ;mRNA; f:78656-78982